MSRIYHSPLTGYIDLDKIARISDAYYMPQRFGAHVGCRIDIQLRDAPIEYSRHLEPGDYTYVEVERPDPKDKWGYDDSGYRLIRVDGVLINPDCDKITEPTDLLCVYRLQEQIDELVAAWKGEV